MGRLHSKGKGISASAIPYSRAPPAWLKVTPDAVVDQICKLAKKGTPLDDDNDLSRLYLTSYLQVPRLRRSEWFFVIPTVLLRSRLSLVRCLAPLEGKQDLIFAAGNKILRILKSNGRSIAT